MEHELIFNDWSTNPFIRPYHVQVDCPGIYIFPGRVSVASVGPHGRWQGGMMPANRFKQLPAIAATTLLARQG